VTAISATQGSLAATVGHPPLFDFPVHQALYELATCTHTTLVDFALLRRKDNPRYQTEHALFRQMFREF